MKYRTIRSTWSIVWATLTVLLCVLWVQSYWWRDSITTANYWHCGSGGGELRIGTFRLFAVLGDRTPGWKRWRNTPQGSRYDRTLASFFGFKRSIDLNTNFWNYITIPYWLPTLVAGVLAAFPSRRLRFSLRTLLIATMLVAVGLGMIVYASR